MPRVLWWGRFDAEYSRNRVLRALLGELGWTIDDFRPALAPLGDLEAHLRRLPRPDLVWSPCFRQRDLAAAARWAHRQGVPLIADPLISAYDKQVDERRKFAPDSARARRLLAWESARLQAADRVLADTAAHADYFHTQLGVAVERLRVVPVGAEEALFRPAPPAARAPDAPLELLFFGSYIPLQGPQVIVEAARRYRGPPARWTLLGQGPLRAACERAAAGLEHVVFEDWLPYAQLPARIHAADAVLGIFGATPKAGRVIPNKAYQALACGRPLITRASPAWPEALARAAPGALRLIPPDDPDALAGAAAELALAPGPFTPGLQERARHPQQLADLATQARALYEQHFSNAAIREALALALRAFQNEARHG